MFNWNDSYVSFLNLDKRPDRLAHVQKELSKAGISAVRTRGKLPQEFNLADVKLQVMKRRTPGAIGCHFGQVEIMTEALRQKKSAVIFEDDVVFCSDMQKRIEYIESFLNKQDDWTFFFLGGTFHSNPAWWHKQGHSPDLQMCRCSLHRDAERTEDPRIMRVYGMFSTHAWIVNAKWVERVLDFLDKHVHLSMGIDWLTILMQPMVNAYCMVPGCVKQMDNLSDIGSGVTRFSGFSMLGPYWWQDKMEDFNPDDHNWGEAERQPITII